MLKNAFKIKHLTLSHENLYQHFFNFRFCMFKNKKFDIENAESIAIDSTTLVKSIQDNETNANKRY